MPKKKFQSQTRKRTPIVDLDYEQDQIVQKEQQQKDLEKTQSKPRTPARFSYQIQRQKVIQYLGGNQMPKNFNHRQKQIKQITQYIYNCLNKTHKSKYKILMVTGSPGAGKSLSVNHILNDMQKNKTLKVIKFNANLIKSMRDAQQLICEKILNMKYGNQMSTLQIIRNLQQQKVKNKYVLYIEEIEIILQQKTNIFTQDFFNLFCNPNIDIMLLGISNTIDAMVKYSKRVSLNIHQIKNIVYKPYQTQTIVKIMKEKIQYVQQKFGFKMIPNDKVLNFVAGKMQNLKRGDIRIVLQFLKQIFNQLLPLKAEQSLSINEQGYALTARIAQVVIGRMIKSKNQIILTLPSMQQIVLIAVYLQITEENSLYATLKQVQNKTKWVCTSLGLQVQSNMVLTGLQMLEQYSLVTRDKKSKQMRIILKVSGSQIQASLEDHSLFKRFFVQEEQIKPSKIKIM